MPTEFEIVEIFIAPKHSYWHLDPSVEAKVRPMQALTEVETAISTRKEE